MSTKIEWVNKAKGIGVFFVVLGHVLRGLNNASLFTGNYFTLIDYSIYTFHMPLFFFLSGIFFLKSYTKRGLKRFIADKFHILFYLYILWSLIMFFIQLGLNDYTNNHTELTDIFNILIIPKGIMWFLYALLTLFIVNAVVFFITPTKRQQLLIVVLIGLGFALRWFDFTEIYILSKIFKSMLFFELGILWSMIAHKFTFNLKHLRFLIPLSIGVFIVTVYYNFEGNCIDFDSQIITTFTGVLSVCFLAFMIKSRALNYLGTYSLHIYLLHILFASGTRIILHKFFHIENLAVHIIAGTIIGLIGSISIIELNRRWVALDFLFKPFYKL